MDWVWPRNVSATMNSLYAVIKAKMLVATRPGATSGNRIRQKIVGALAPSMAAASSSSLGTVATKLRSIQIDTGSACAAYTRIRPSRFSSRPSRLKSRNSAMIRAWPGIICTMSSMTSTEARNLNLNLATATDARSETSDARSTVARVTAMLLRKNSHTEPIPDAWPLITCAKLPSVGCAGVRSGVREKISCDGLNAVDTIHAIGNSVTRATSTPVPLRLMALSLFGPLPARGDDPPGTLRDLPARGDDGDGLTSTPAGRPERAGIAGALM